MEGSSGTRRSIRANTFRIDYDGIPRRPSRSEVIDFVVDHLHLGANIAAIQHCNSLGRVYIEMQTAEQAREAVYQNGQKHAITVDGKAYAVPLSLEDGTTEVRLLELPSYVTVAEIKAEMASLGEIISVEEELYGEDTKVPGVRTGIRVIKVIPKDGSLRLGPTLTIGGERTPIIYAGQEAYCKYCLMPEHKGKTCAQTKRESYADMAKRTPAPAPAPAPTTSTAHAQKNPLGQTKGQTQKVKKTSVPRPVHTSLAQARLEMARRNNLPQPKDAPNVMTTLTSVKPSVQTSPFPTSSSTRSLSTSVPKPSTVAPTTASTSAPTQRVVANADANDHRCVKQPSTHVPASTSTSSATTTVTSLAAPKASVATSITVASKMPLSDTPAARENASVEAAAGRSVAKAPEGETDWVTGVLVRGDTASDTFKIPRDRSPPVQLPSNKGKRGPDDTTDSDSGSVKSNGSKRGPGRPRKSFSKPLPKKLNNNAGQDTNGDMEISEA